MVQNDPPSGQLQGSQGFFEDEVMRLGRQVASTIPRTERVRRPVGQLPYLNLTRRHEGSFLSAFVTSSLGAETYVGGEMTGLIFELLQPLVGPGLWQNFLDEKGEGVYSIAVMFKTLEQSAAAKRHFEAHGMPVNMAARIGDQIEYYYVDSAPILKRALRGGLWPCNRLVKPLYGCLEE